MHVYYILTATIHNTSKLEGMTFQLNFLNLYFLLPLLLLPLFSIFLCQIVYFRPCGDRL